MPKTLIKINLGRINLFLKRVKDYFKCDLKWLIYLLSLQILLKKPSITHLKYFIRVEI